MKKVFFVIFVLTLSTLLFGGSPFKVTDKKVLNDGQTYLLSPQWSPDGRFLAAAGANYEAIWCYDVEQSGWTKLVEENGAGWDFSWSPDSKNIAFRSNVFEKRRKKTAIKVVEVATKKIEQPVEFGKNYSTPRWITNDMLAFVDNDQLKTVEVTDKKDDTQVSSIKQHPVILSTANGYIVRSGEGVQILPDNPEQQIFNPAYSPDGTRIVYEKPGGGIYLLNLKTDQETQITTGEMPAWSPDGKYIVYAMPTDDGHQILASDLWICDVNGTSKQQITETSDVKEMHPAWSPDGASIACDDAGEIIVLSITQNKIKTYQKVKESRENR